jgi:hypothetical protein
MKKPIIEDFDPDAKTRQLGSPPDSMPRIVKPTPAITPFPTAVQQGTLPERSFERTGVRPNGKRIITRNSFETYEDQMESLRELSFQEKRQGRLGSMSAMVRDAIDQYLKKHSKT